MPNFMDRIMGGLLGPSQNYGGLLNPQDEANAQNQARMALFSNLLASSGYSNQPTSIGQALGGAMNAGRQAQSDGLQSALQAQLMRSQIAKNERPNLPTSAEEFEYFKNLSPEDQAIFNSMKAKAGPAAIQEFEYFKQLPTEDQQTYIKLQRQPTVPKVVMIGNVPHLVDPVTGTRTPLSTLEQEATGAGAVAAATAGGKVEGETTSTAKFDLPRIEDNASQTLTLLDRLKNHPGRKMATGASSAIPVDKLPATEARDFVALLGQLRGKQFLEAFNMLKGGGQITEVEGAKAESAIATIQDRGQSEEAYLQAIEDLRGVINSGVTRARQKAGGGSSPKPTETAAERAKRLGL
jgi:hypothetical protein